MTGFVLIFLAIAILVAIPVTVAIAEGVAELAYRVRRYRRLPSVKRALVPTTVRRKANLVPSGRAVAARTGRTVRRTITSR